MSVDQAMTFSMQCSSIPFCQENIPVTKISILRVVLLLNDLKYQNCLRFLFLALIQSFPISCFLVVFFLFFFIVFLRKT